MRSKILLLLLVLLLNSCQTTKYVEIPKVIKETEYITNKDIQYITDSIYIEAKPDTFYKYRERTVYRERVDTVIVNKTDSIVIPQIIEKETIKYNNKPIILLSTILILTYGIIIKKKLEKR